MTFTLDLADLADLVDVVDLAELVDQMGQYVSEWVRMMTIRGASTSKNMKLWKLSQWGEVKTKDF